MSSFLFADFKNLTVWLKTQISANESFRLNLTGESSRFARYTKSKIRHSHEVEQHELTLVLQAHQKEAEINFTLGLNEEENKKRLFWCLDQLRGTLVEIPENPYFVAIAGDETSENKIAGKIPTWDDLLIKVPHAAKHLDLAGFAASGSMIRGSSNSLGQLHWFETENFFIDYSLYSGDRSSKAIYSGSHFDIKEFEKTLRAAEMKLKLLEKPKRKISAGKYRVYMEPGAVAEIVSTLQAWQFVFSYNQYKKGHTIWRDLIENGQKLSPLVSFYQDFKIGVDSQFNRLGEVSPTSLPLIENGEWKNFLVSTQTAREYEILSNKADTNEDWRSARMGSGSLHEVDILKQLGTGVYLSNLHYLNFSDPKTARITGMTRFASFWVENGEIQGPIEDMRFDISLLEIFGAELESLTKETETLVSTLTYQQRSLGGMQVPGALVNNFTFTL